MCVARSHYRKKMFSIVRGNGLRRRRWSSSLTRLCNNSDDERKDRQKKKNIQQTFTCSKSTIKTLKKVWNMFKVNNKNTRTMSLTSFWWIYCYLWTYFITFSSASIVDFEQVNVSRVRMVWLFNYHYFFMFICKMKRGTVLSLWINFFEARTFFF